MLTCISGSVNEELASGQTPSLSSVMIRPRVLRGRPSGACYHNTLSDWLSLKVCPFRK